MNETTALAKVSDLTEIVNENIRVEMTRRKVTAKDLASALGLSYAALWRRMTGVVPWDLIELAAVAEHLGVDPRLLLAATP